MYLINEGRTQIKELLTPATSIFLLLTSPQPSTVSGFATKTGLTKVSHELY